MKQTSWLSGFVAVRRPSSAGPAPDVVLGQRTDREQRAGEIVLAEHVHDVALVLLAVGAAFEGVAVSAAPDAGVMAGGDGVEAELRRPLGEAGELDPAVALDARVRRRPRAMGRNVRGDDMGVEVLGEVEHEMLDTEGVGRPPGVVDVGDAAAPGVALAAPQAHRHADDVVAVSSEQGGGDGRVHTAAHRHHHLAHWRTMAVCLTVGRDGRCTIELEAP